jgi:outer membrane receptor protein involved in Fe transport
LIRRVRILAVGGTVGFGGLVAAPLAAQDLVEPYPLGEIVVSADEPASEASATVRQVTAADIEAYGARTLDEAIGLLPGVYVRLGADGTPRVDLRGLRTRQVTLLLDGVPLNATSDGQFDPSLLPVEQIAEIKLTSGAGSVLYGSGGLAGTINVITRRGSERPSGSLRGEWRERDSWLGRATAGAGGGLVRAFASASGATVGEVPSFIASPTLGDASSGQRLASDRDRLNVFGRVEAVFGPAATGSLTVMTTEANAGVPPSVIDDPLDPFANRAAFERVEDIDGLALQGAASALVTREWTIRAWGYRNLSDQLTQRYSDERFDPATVLTAAGTFRDESRSVLSGGSVQIATTSLPGGRVTLGLTARHAAWRQELREAVAVTAGGGGGGSGGGGGGGGVGWEGGSTVVQVQTDTTDRALWEYGAALEYDVRPIRNVGLVAGAMYHRLDASALDDGAWGASLGAYADVSPRVRTRASYGRRLRFPTLRQLYDAAGGNEALVPEQADLYELGLELALSRGVSLGIAGYRTDARNFIERPQGAPQFVNAERYRLQGLEIDAAFRGSRGLLVRGRYTFLDAEDRTAGREGTVLQYRPRHTVSTEVRVTAPWGLEAAGTLRYVARQVYETRREPLIQADLPDYAVVGVRLQQRLGRSPIALFAGADNLFAAAYEQSYGFPQAGRVVYLGFDLRP